MASDEQQALSHRRDSDRGRVLVVQPPHTLAECDPRSRLTPGLFSDAMPRGGIWPCLHFPAIDRLARLGRDALPIDVVYGVHATGGESRATTGEPF